MAAEVTVSGKIDAGQLEDLVVANRVLYREKVLDGFGHVSVRSIVNPSQFLISRNLAPGLVTEQDIVVMDLAGQLVAPQGTKTYMEVFIHAAIYESRPDVIAVVHSHSPNVVPFGVVKRPMKPVFHMSGFLGEGVPVFDIRTEAGETDLLIKSRPLGQALARCLGKHCVVLMRGHGDTVTGASLPEAVFRAVYTETNAKLQLNAIQLDDEVTYLSAEEAKLTNALAANTLERAWNLWKEETLAEMKHR